MTNVSRIDLCTGQYRHSYPPTITGRSDYRSGIDNYYYCSRPDVETSRVTSRARRQPFSVIKISAIGFRLWLYARREVWQKKKKITTDKGYWVVVTRLFIFFFFYIFSYERLQRARKTPGAHSDRIKFYSYPYKYTALVQHMWPGPCNYRSLCALTCIRPCTIPVTGSYSGRVSRCSSSKIITNNTHTVMVCAVRFGPKK